MNIAVIGARRKRNGTGEYICKYLHFNDARVVCVLGTTEKSAQDASKSLRRYGIESRPYHDFQEMLSSEDLDAIAIASPADTHHDYLLTAARKGLSIFCEKPFLDPGRPHLAEDLEILFTLSAEHGATVAMNSQLPFCIPSYEELCGMIEPAGVRRFSIRLSPGCTGIEMIPDSVPHGLSILYSALGAGEVCDLSFVQEQGSMTICFVYASRHGDCDVTVSLVQEQTQPRTLSFGFNETIVRRSIDMVSYDMSFVSGDKTLRIPDPLELSVRDFIQAQLSNRSPAIGREHIISTTLILKQIYDAYADGKRTTWKN